MNACARRLFVDWLDLSLPQPFHLFKRLARLTHAEGIETFVAVAEMIQFILREPGVVGTEFPEDL